MPLDAAERTGMLQKASFQSEKGIRDFYKEGRGALDPIDAEEATGMLALLDVLEPRLADKDVWAFTSLNWLCLIPANRHHAAAVKIAGSGDRYYVEYLMPADEAPWPGAIVRGETCGVSNAVAMVETAMTKSGAWPA